MTSDERIDVAERLRKEAKTVSFNYERLWVRLEIAVNGWKFGDAVDDSYALNNDVFARLADLIDPTCSMADCEWDNGERMWGCVCSACGAHIERTHGCLLDYCPHCGARCADDD